MNTIKKRDNNFTQVSNSFLRDNNISFKAKGLFCYMFSMSDGWNFTMQSIAAQQNDGLSSIKSAMDELKQYGYIVYEKHANGKGTYHLNDEPKVENPNVENPNVGFTKEGKSTPIKNTNLNKKNNSKNTNDNKVNKFTPPSLEEVKAYIVEKNINVNANKFYEFFDVSNWIDSKGNKVKNWKQKLLTWANYNKTDNSKSNTTNSIDEWR